MNAAATRRLVGLNAHLAPAPSAGVLKWISNLFGGGSDEEGHGHGHGDDDHSHGHGHGDDDHGHGHGEEERRPPAPDGSPRTGEKNDGELSFERALSAFEDKDAGWYDIVEKNGISLIYKAMEFAEFEEKISDIDRSESRTGFYAVEDGDLKLHEEPDELPDWDDERRALHTSRVRTAVVDNGGAIIGAFDLQPNGHQVLVGVTVLDGQWLGEAKDTLDMYFLFVSKELKPKYVEAGGSQKNFRDAGIGGTLLERVAAEAEARGAKKMYISAANGQHTVDFYMRRGAELAEEVLTELTDKDDANTVFSAGFPDIQLAKPLGGS